MPRKEQSVWEQATALIARRAHSRGELRRKLAARSSRAAARHLAPDDIPISTVTGNAVTDREYTPDTAYENAIEAALDRLERLRLLDDAAFACEFALSRKISGWGETRIRAALREREVEDSLIERALENMATATSVVGATTEDIDENTAALDQDLLACVNDYCRKKGTPATPRQARSLIAHLQRRGFTADSIRVASLRILPEDVRQQIEPEMDF